MAITNASKLIELELSYNFFTGSVPTNLGNLWQLQCLNLASNQLTNELRNLELEFINSLVECQMLQFIIVGNNPLNGILPDSVGNLSSSLEMFNIENGQINGHIPRGIGHLSSIISLFLNGNNLSGSIPSEVGKIKQLQKLYLSRNELQGSIPEELCHLINVEYGTGGIVSTSGDVYSYGIMLMETFTKRKPTKEMFTGNSCLRYWVKSSYPTAVMKIVDANLFNGEDEIGAAEQICISSVIELALDCSRETPEGRIKMQEVVVRLKKIKQRLEEPQRLAF
ncbi:hypothetical protein F0562_030532 [Nyssa sinensis]|uniref:Serine-threonine/tyrosine-protein kinase catalytic domain-containing protein n=1 Tax=Nyssa sinensis TaxID=561372 RepID=A0A5J5AYT8_9ASTE|nr:hypothetical protein F0562_030532 [Nyssa sinensis]